MLQAVVLSEGSRGMFETSEVLEQLEQSVGSGPSSLVLRRDGPRISDMLGDCGLRRSLEARGPGSMSLGWSTRESDSG